MTADRHQAHARQRQQRARLHFLSTHPVQQRMLVRMQAPADRLAGGELRIGWPADEVPLTMAGPATFVFEGEFSAP